MKDIKTELKGSLGPTVRTVDQLKIDTEHNFSDLMEIIKDLDSRLLMIERKLEFIVVPKPRTEDDWIYDGSYGGTD